MKTIRSISQAALLLAAILALVPLGQAARSWYEIARYQADVGDGFAPSARGSDWVLWEDLEGGITAGYVFPNGPGDKAGILEGDRFYTLEYQQYFDTEDLKNAIAGIRPGLTRQYMIVRDGEPLDVSVTMDRHPTFLYPHSPGVWQFAIWGFTLAAFFHLLALFIALPLALHSRRALFEAVVIGVSSLWIIGNLVRLLSIELFGPPVAETTYDIVFQSFTLIGLAGWIGFPVMLIRKLTSDAGLAQGKLGRFLWAAYLAPAILTLAVITAALEGHVGPYTMEKLLEPILFYASCYIGIAAAVSFGLSFVDRSKSGRSTIQWGRVDSLVIFGFSLVVALAVVDIIPVFNDVSDKTAAWLIVSAQLLAVVPVTLYSVGTLRYGKVDEVLSGAFVYVLVIGLIFFTFVGGLSMMDSVLSTSGNTRIVLEGFYVVLLLVVFERLSRRLRIFASAFFASERFRGRKIISRFQEELPDVMEEGALAQRAIDVVGKVFGARSAIIFIKSPAGGNWVIKRFSPEAPYLTEQVFENIWTHFEYEPTIWARNPELNAHPLPSYGRDILMQHGAALAVPIKDDAVAIGLIILGMKTRRGSVYNLEDLDQLRSLAGNLALAVDRLSLVEREKTLAAESSRAHLVALRAQINPHFLFNALNTVLSLIEERPEEAEAVVEHLAAIFRHTLNTSSQTFVKMEEEISLVEHYLAIERARFGSRLSVECDVAPSLKSHPVPAFAVQTLVENAIKHGLEKRRTGGSLSIAVQEHEKDDVKVIVCDSGVGIPSLFELNKPSRKKASFFGVGLSNVYDRLHQLYDRDDLLQFESDPGKGTRVSMIVPLMRSGNHNRSS